jgi:hypothetical protein
VRLPSSPTILDRYIAALGIASVIQTFLECAHKIDERIWRRTAEEPNHRDSRPVGRICQNPTHAPQQNGGT